jgi:hypothetical protein
VADTFSVDNQLRYSEDSSKWGHPGSTVTMNAVEGPFGGLAAKVVNTATAYPAGINSSPVPAAAPNYVLSVYAKAAGRRWLMMEWSAAGAHYAFFDLQNGVTGNTSGGAVPTILAIGNGWYRCSITHASTPTYVGFDIVSGNGSATAPTPDGSSGLYFWGAQLNIGTVAGDYILTTGEALLARIKPRAGVSAAGELTFAGTGTCRPRARIAGATGLQIISGTAATAARPKIALGSAIEVFSGSGTVYANPRADSGVGLEVFAGVGAAHTVARVTGTGEELFSGTAEVHAAAAASGFGCDVVSGAGAVGSACKAGGTAAQIFAGSGTVSAGLPLASAAGSELFAGTAAISARARALAAGVFTIKGFGLVTMLAMAAGRAYSGVPSEVPPQRVVTIPRAVRHITVGRSSEL